MQNCVCRAGCFVETQPVESYSYLSAEAVDGYYHGQGNMPDYSNIFWIIIVIILLCSTTFWYILYIICSVVVPAVLTEPKLCGWL